MLNPIQLLVENLKRQLDLVLDDNLDNFSNALKSLEIFQKESLKMIKLENSIQSLSDEAKIHFFKTLKPIFISHYFYHRSIIEFEIFKMKNRSNFWIVYFEMERDKFQDFNFKYSDYIPTFKTISSVDDEIYFTSDSCSHSIYDERLWLELYKDNYPKFDILMAQYLANERLDFFLINQIKETQILEFSLKNNTVQWNGNNVQFVEHVSSLYASKLVGRKDMKLADLFDDFGLIMNYKVKNHYKELQDIKKRTGSKSKLLGQLTFDYNIFIQNENDKIK